jgi:hypothetical protein
MEKRELPLIVRRVVVAREADAEDELVCELDCGHVVQTRILLPRYGTPNHVHCRLCEENRDGARRESKAV